MTASCEARATTTNAIHGASNGIARRVSRVERLTTHTTKSTVASDSAIIRPWLIVRPANAPSCRSGVAPRIAYS